MQGAIGGVLGGILFALVEVATSVATSLSPADPFRVIASMVLESGAIAPGGPWDAAATTGLALHFLLSVLYGVVLVAIVAVTRVAEIPRSMFLLLGIVYAMVLWTVNFLIVAPAMFPEGGLGGVFQLGFALAHPAYGLGLGGYLAAVRRQEEGDTVAGRS